MKSIVRKILNWRFLCQRAAILCFFNCQENHGLEINKPSEEIWDSRTRSSIKLTTEEDSKVLILNGEPIDETIVAYGPFMMSTKKEVMEAFRDFQEGQMGNLVL